MSLELDHLVQRRIFAFSEEFEQKRAKNGTLNQKDLTVFFFKEAIRLGLAHASFPMLVGVGRVLHSYSTRAIMDMYGTIAPNRAGLKNDEQCRLWKKKTMDYLLNRFSPFISIETGVRGERRFKTTECPHLRLLAHNCLRRFVPDRTSHPIPPDCDRIAPDVLDYDGSADGEHTTELLRFHACICPVCLAYLTSAWNLESPDEHTEVPLFSLSPRTFAGDDYGDRGAPPELTDDAVDEALQEIAEERERRKRVSPAVLRIFVDGWERARFDCRSGEQVLIPVMETEEVIEIVSDGGEVLVCHLMTHGDEDFPGTTRSEYRLGDWMLCFAESSSRTVTLQIHGLRDVTSVVDHLRSRSPLHNGGDVGIVAVKSASNGSRTESAPTVNRQNGSDRSRPFVVPIPQSNRRKWMVAGIAALVVLSIGAAGVAFWSFGLRGARDLQSSGPAPQSPVRPQETGHRNGRRPAARAGTPGGPPSELSPLNTARTPLPEPPNVVVGSFNVRGAESGSPRGDNGSGGLDVARQQPTAGQQTQSAETATAGSGAGSAGGDGNSNGVGPAPRQATAGQQTLPHPTPTSGGDPDANVIAVFANRAEGALVSTLRETTPLVEAYFQHFRSGDHATRMPDSDRYLLARFAWTSKPTMMNLWPQQEETGQGESKKTSGDQELLDGLVQVMVPDWQELTPERYEYRFVGSELLGSVRCLVYDVLPKNREAGSFSGRVYFEDRTFNVVRFVGTNPHLDAALRALREGNSQFHIDSWRLNVAPNRWVPAYAYIQEVPPLGSPEAAVVKGQVRFWGYNRAAAERSQQTSLSLQRSSSAMGAQARSPQEVQRMYDSQAEDNVLSRLYEAGLLATPGQVEKLLDQVLTNLIIPNGVVLPQPIRCRIILTSRLEAFSVGKTIVVSRGLIDVAPDESAIALILAHQLAHSLLGHPTIDSRLAFPDVLRISDADLIAKLRFRRSPSEEAGADDKSLQLLENSPYKPALPEAALFIQAIQARGSQLSGLISPMFGEEIADLKQRVRNDPMTRTAQIYDPNSRGPARALPLGSKLVVNPWDGRVELFRSARDRTVPYERTEFAVMPFAPNLEYFAEKATVPKALPGTAARPAPVTRPPVPATRRPDGH
ncbi:MAG: M48 family metalloprotease [Acidobacteriia bacterium]|nr:M48 family metalloprotease [Terriglobia bacterium]